VSRDHDLAAARRRVRVVVGLFVVALAILGLRLGDLALMSVDAATAGHPGASVPSSTRRADIVDRHGNLVATDYPKSSLFGDPAEVLDPQATANQLAPILGLDAASIGVSLSAPRRFVWLKRHLSEAERLAVLRLGLPGIGFRTEWHRIYPQRELTSHLVGSSSFLTSCKFLSKFSP
jgi:cell division protein FtsI (penicillin-binding protein 3)